MAERTGDLYDVFISYAHADRAWVEGCLLDALTQAGLRCHTEADFALGAPRIEEIERAVRQSRRTLLVLSPAYQADHLNRFADLLAQSFGTDTATWPVIPLILQPVDLPLRLAMLVGLDATDPSVRPGVIERLVAEFQRPLPPPLPVPCPYPGMAPFTEADSSRFYGRATEVRESVERLRLHPFLTIIGPSGSGKSSLVFAGLIPALRASRRFGPGEWDVRAMRPGATPLETLRLTLGDAVNLETFQRPDREASRLLLVVDQFEEVFTLRSPQTDEADTFQSTLARLADLPGCYVVLTVRADFFADLLTCPLWPRIKDHRFEVLPLDAAGLRQAIVRPAEDAGVYVEAALVERLIADAAGEPGVLPFMQETLTLLWEHLERHFLPLRAYEALVLPGRAHQGAPRTGLQVAMARHADAALAALPEAQQAVARRIFLRLVQFGEGRADTRRQQAVAFLRDVAPADAFEETLQHLVRWRLLTLTGGEGEQRIVDLAHEALITGWPTLAQWLTERRGAELTRRRLEGKAAEWERLGRGLGGLLDEVELLEAQRWLASSDAADLGYGEALSALVQASQLAVERAAQEREAARQRELALERRARRNLQGIVAILSLVTFVSMGILIFPFVVGRIVRSPVVRIEAGPAIVGADSAEMQENESPTSTVNLPTFAIERYEVTNYQYWLCYLVRRCTYPTDPSRFDYKQRPRHPVVGVTALQAAEYCRWVGRRLPTELEWERAARGSEGRPWPWGDAPPSPDLANLNYDNDSADTAEVDAYPDGATPEGVFNLVGNVWEWTSSYSPFGSESGTQAVWDNRPDTLDFDNLLVRRGGGWSGPLERITIRQLFPATAHSESVGLRCAR